MFTESIFGQNLMRIELPHDKMGNKKMMINDSSADLYSFITLMYI